MKNKENIVFFIEEKENEKEVNNMDIKTMRKLLHNRINILDHNDYGNDYESYTLKELYLICEYYEILTFVKKNKYTKKEIIKQILLFENNIDNIEIVERRQTLWFYLSELKNDNILKKYILMH
jgi:hypothetical protein